MASLWQACAGDVDRLLLSLLSAGLRRSEAASVRWQDLDGDVLTVTGKGRKLRRVLVQFGALPPQHHGSILGMEPKTVYRRFKQIARKAGYPNVHPHQLRHTYATDMLRKGMSPLALQTLGGWADQRMLSRYAKGALEEAALNEARRLQP